MAKVGQLIQFPEYMPDLSPLGQTASSAMYNVVPRNDGYGPVLGLQQYTQALPGPCRGYFFGRKTDGTITIFAGTATDLYVLNNTTFTWTLASQGNVSYAQLPSTDNWQFVQFNDLVIAVQANTTPQKFILSSATNFVDLGGSPPFAAAISIIGFFVVLTALTSNQRRAQWSDLDAPESWTAGIGLSDFQDFPDGGSCLTTSGGDAFGLIFQEQAIRSMTYAAGTVAIFQFYRMSTQEALYGKYSVINIGDRVFFCGAAGFKMVSGTQAPSFIGKEKTDRTFFGDVDPSSSQLLIGASDPTSTRVYWAYKSLSGQAGVFDRILVYDYLLNKWTRLSVVGEYIASLAKPGLTLESLDAIAPGGSLDALPFSLDSIAKASITQISAFDNTNVLGFFTGSTLEATLETGDADGVGQFVFTNALMPLTDAWPVFCSIGWRNSPFGAVTYTAETVTDDQGQAPFEIESRFQRARVRIPAGAKWTFCRGVQPDSQLAGER